MYPVRVIDSTTSLEKVYGSLLDQVPCLRDRISVTELSGGLTNRNLLVHNGTKKYVARISSNSSSLLSIDRESEYQNSLLAAEMGIAPEVHCYLPGQGLLVIEFLNGQTFSAKDVSENLPRIAQSCQVLHSAKPFVSSSAGVLPF